MTKHTPEQVKSRIESILSDMSDHRWLFTANPGHDFTRQEQGKLSFYDTIRLILSMGKGNLSDELVGYFDMDVDSIPCLISRSEPDLPVIQHLKDLWYQVCDPEVALDLFRALTHLFTHDLDGFFPLILVVILPIAAEPVLALDRVILHLAGKSLFTR